MTRILLLSDTHNHLDKRMLAYIEQADEVWHAGDIGSVKITDTISSITALRAVYGNIDGDELRSQFPGFQYFELENQRIFMTHIGGYPGKYRKRVKAFIEQHPVDIFIAGHSHILKIIYDKKYRLLHLNPGAAGISGFHKVRTMLRFELHRGKMQNLEIIEMQKHVTNG